MQTQANESNPASWRAAGVAAGCAAGLALLVPAHPGAFRLAGDDPTAPVAALCGWGAWVLAAYLLTGAGLGALRHLLPSPRVLDALLARVLPRALRRVVDVAVGTTTVAAVLAAPAAAHADARPGAVTAVSDLDWPGLVQAVSPAPGPQPAAAPASAVLVVRPGDSLWTLAARRLGPHASPAAVAAEWPRLYAANRAVIGADPSLLRPGQHLRVPAHDPEDQP